MNLPVADLIFVPIVMGLGTLKMSWYLRRSAYVGSWYQRHVQLLGILMSLVLTIAYIGSVQDMKRSGIVFIIALLSFWGTRWVVRSEDSA